MTEIFLERFAVNGLNLINCMIAEPQYNRCEFSESWQLTGMMVREGGPFITTAAPPVGVGVCKNYGKHVFLTLIKYFSHTF